MKKKLKVALIAVLVIVLLVLVACGAYFIILKVQEKKALSTIDSMFVALKSGDEEAIKKYINIEDENDEANSEEKNDAEESIMDDEAMTKAMVQNISYEVVSKDTKLNNCTVQLNISNKNFKTIFTNYISQAFSLALSSAFGGMTEEAMSAKLEQYLIDQYNSDDVETVTTQVAMTVKKENGEWTISCDDNEMLNALLPGYTEAISSLNSVTQE